MKIGESSNVLKKVVKENTIDRTRNVILHNIPESESQDAVQRLNDDAQKVNSIINSLCGNRQSIKCVQAFRLQRKQRADANEVDRRPRLMMVKLDKAEEVDFLLRNRFQLREAWVSECLPHQRSLQGRA